MGILLCLLFSMFSLGLIGCSASIRPLKTTTRIDPIFGRETPVLFAHRGGAMEVAESTRKGFRHAIRAGADVLELDVHALNAGREGREREFVVWHGPELTNVRISSLQDPKATLPRERTKRENDICEWNWEDLKGKAWVADPVEWMDSNGKKKPIKEIDLSNLEQCNDRLMMTLRELLQEFPNSHVNIELKDSFTPEDLPKLVELLDRHRNKRTILVVTQSSKTIEAFRNLSGGRYPTGFSLAGVVAACFGGMLPFNPFPDLKNNRALQTTYNRIFTPTGLIRDVQARNGAVHVFLTSFTCLAPAIDAEEGMPKDEELFKILNRGVDGVMTDRPEHVRSLIDAWRKKFTQ